MSERRRYLYSLCLTDQASATMLSTILAYESLVRGATVGQTLFELLMQAADLDSYPDKLRESLAETDARRLLEGASYAALCAGLERSA